ncbi:hypothetical protein J3R82DRAFT_2801 [Butyriboletus roseoflavus]|nr:hypothetical protein J3R82DRAFT_2801 [Butyriboletus roseoflavus]
MAMWLTQQRLGYASWDFRQVSETTCDRIPVQNIIRMEFKFSVLYPYALASLSQTEKPTKTPKSPTQNLLANHTPRTPHAWFDNVNQWDPERRYVITEISLYKERTVFGYQHEFVLLVTQPRQTAQTTSEDFAPVTIRVSRTIAGDSLPARLDLWGTANDKFTILGDLGTIQMEHDRLHHLTWEPQHAPTLLDTSHLIVSISDDISQYHLTNASCYIFSLAILEAANLTFNGIGEAQQPHYLTRQMHFLWYIPVAAKKAHDIARAVISRQPQ